MFLTFYWCFIIILFHLFFVFFLARYSYQGFWDRNTIPALRCRDWSGIVCWFTWFCYPLSFFSVKFCAFSVGHLGKVRQLLRDSVLCCIWTNTLCIFSAEISANLFSHFWHAVRQKLCIRQLYIYIKNMDMWVNVRVCESFY